MIDLIESLLLVTGVIVVCSPIAWLILQVGNWFDGDTKKKNNSQANKQQARLLPRI